MASPALDRLRLLGGHLALRLAANREAQPIRANLHPLPEGTGSCRLVDGDRTIAANLEARDLGDGVELTAQATLIDGWGLEEHSFGLDL